jgi:hypothetical protein
MTPELKGCGVWIGYDADGVGVRDYVLDHWKVIDEMHAFVPISALTFIDISGDGAVGAGIRGRNEWKSR